MSNEIKLPASVKGYKKPNVTPQSKKRCAVCGATKASTDFTVNKQWVQEGGYDSCCKQCLSKVKTKTQFKKFLWQNRRQWSNQLWSTAQKNAAKLLDGNEVYQRSDVNRRKVLIENLAAQQAISIMNEFKYYKYTTANDGKQFIQEEEAEHQYQTPQTKKYNKEWNGYFDTTEIEFLNNYYHKLQNDFTFDNESTRDYARKVCKASLQMDKAYDLYASGKCDSATFRDATNIFDTLSKSANFAACKRKPGETQSGSSWSQTTMKLETTGQILQTKIEWPKDDIDICIDDLRHTVKALGLDKAW